MPTTKYHRLRTDCLTAIADHNLEKCFELLAESLDDRGATYSNYIELRGQLSSALQLFNRGRVTAQEHTMTINQIREGLLYLVNDTLEPSDVSLLRRIHDRILIVVQMDSRTDWTGLFPEAFFSHICIIHYGQEVPNLFQSPDVVIFDDLNSIGTDHYDHITQLSEAMPDANLLYFKNGRNPFENGTPEEQAIFPRMANANSKFTVHARLRELLEFRKIYGVP